MKRKAEGKDSKNDDREVKAVMFCPYTPARDLAKRLREAENEMNKLTSYRMKVVEEAGDKLVDMLRSTNPWKGEHCGRADCWLCWTKELTGRDKTQDCTKRSVVYETWCDTCLKNDIKKIEDETEDDDVRKARIEEVPRYKYVGETARSGYERGVEHQNDLEKLQEDSHLLKHIASKHRGEELENIKFGMRIIKHARTALERQVTESVKIQEEQKKHFLLNSKSEYNRCSLPRLTAKLGNKDYDKIRQEELRQEKEEELRVREEIRVRMKEKCKRRKQELHTDEMQERENKLHKKRKVGETGEYKTVYQVRQEEKRERENENPRDDKKK